MREVRHAHLHSPGAPTPALEHSFLLPHPHHRPIIERVCDIHPGSICDPPRKLTPTQSPGPTCVNAEKSTRHTKAPPPRKLRGDGTLREMERGGTSWWS